MKKVPADINLEGPLAGRRGTQQANKGIKRHFYRHRVSVQDEGDGT